MAKMWTQRESKFCLYQRRADVVNMLRDAVNCIFSSLGYFLYNTILEIFSACQNLVFYGICPFIVRPTVRYGLSTFYPDFRDSKKQI